MHSIAISKFHEFHLLFVRIDLSIEDLAYSNYYISLDKRR